MTFDQTSVFLSAAVEWLRLALEALGAFMIGAGTVALALEFQLAADVLKTAVAPEWNKIGHLAAIGAIRTALNYFISRELTQQRPEAQRRPESSVIRDF